MTDLAEETLAENEQDGQTLADAINKHLAEREARERAGMTWYTTEIRTGPEPREGQPDHREPRHCVCHTDGQRLGVSSAMEAVMVAAWLNERDTKIDRLTAELAAEREAREAVVADNAVLLDALQQLYDHQNGCPLPKYEEGWNAAMALAQNCLATLHPGDGLLDGLLEALRRKDEALRVARKTFVAQGWVPANHPHGLIDQIDTALAKLDGGSRDG